MGKAIVLLIHWPLVWPRVVIRTCFSPIKSKVWVTARPCLDKGFLQASHTLARSAYLLLKCGLELSVMAASICPCAFARAVIISLICSDCWLILIPHKFLG